MYSWEQAVDWLRHQPDQKELVYHCYYDDPVQEAAERFSKSEEWYAVVRLIEKYLPGKVLDLGAGRGISSYAFTKQGCHVVALEPDSGDIVGTGAIKSLMNSTNSPIEIIQEHGETLPFPDNSFDVVYGRAVLHHAVDLTKLCQESARVLKSGGIFLATREHVISRHEDLQKFFDGHAIHKLYGGENAYLLNEYLAAVTRSSLELKSLLGPYDSVINYAPMTHDEFRSKFVKAINKYLGFTVARWLSKSESLQMFYGRSLSRRSDVPGRHYSFLAVKP